jgi:hypothetical protein
MASSYSTDLKLELMVTGEKAGQWGDITNSNLVVLQQAIAGYEQIGVTTGATLTFSNGVTSNGKNAVIDLTGTIATSVDVIVPDGIEKTYIIKNSTTGSHAVRIKTTSGTGPSFATTDKGYKLVYVDGTNVTDVSLSSPPGGSDTQIQFNDGGTSFGGSASLTWDGSNVTIGSAQGDLRLTDDDQSHYVALQAGAMAANLTLTLPTTDGTTGQVIQTNGSGALSFGDVVGGESWQAVKTTGFTAVAGEGYFIDTSSAAITMTLPSSPSIGDFVSFIDYAGTFDTNNLTIGRNSENIQGSAADLTVSVERAANTLVYTDGTQGWLLKVK